MNGYLMLEKEWIRGEDLFIENFSPESRAGVVFEDDGAAAYFYAVEKDEDGTAGIRILDALHIYEPEEEEDDPSLHGPADEEPTPSRLQIVWSRDWMKCALVIDGYCHALFDFEAHGGYNINEFPPPNDFWTRGDRSLNDELISRLF